MNFTYFNSSDFNATKIAYDDNNDELEEIISIVLLILFIIVCVILVCLYLCLMCQRSSSNVHVGHSIAIVSGVKIKKLFLFYEQKLYYYPCKFEIYYHILHNYIQTHHHLI